MAIIKNVLKRNLPGIQSQRLWRTPRRPIVPTQSQPFQHPTVGNPEWPVSDTYADGVPEERDF